VKQASCRPESDWGLENAAQYRARKKSRREGASLGYASLLQPIDRSRRVAAMLLPKRLHEPSTRRKCPVVPYEPSILMLHQNCPNET